MMTLVYMLTMQTNNGSQRKLKTVSCLNLLNGVMIRNVESNILQLLSSQQSATNLILVIHHLTMQDVARIPCVKLIPSAIAQDALPTSLLIKIQIIL